MAFEKLRAPRSRRTKAKLHGSARDGCRRRAQIKRQRTHSEAAKRAKVIWHARAQQMLLLLKFLHQLAGCGWDRARSLALTKVNKGERTEHSDESQIESAAHSSFCPGCANIELFMQTLRRFVLLANSVVVVAAAKAAFQFRVSFACRRQATSHVFVFPICARIFSAATELFIFRWFQQLALYFLYSQSMNNEQTYVNQSQWFFSV